MSNSIISDLNAPNRDLTLMVMQWGQFLDHDMTHTPLIQGNSELSLRQKHMLDTTQSLSMWQIFQMKTATTWLAALTTADSNLPVTSNTPNVSPSPSLKRTGSSVDSTKDAWSSSDLYPPRIPNAVSVPESK